MDRPRDALHHIDEALAAGRGLMRRRVPEAMKRAAAGVPQLVISEALPLAKALLGEIGVLRRVGAGDQGGAGEPGADDGPRRLVGAPQIARHPHRISRQLPRETGEDGGLATVARHVLLAVDPPAALDRGVPHPPEPRRRRRVIGAQPPIAGRVRRG